MEFISEIIILIAALAAGFVNALAGGGTLITFPILIATGIQPVTANITNTVALVPGTVGGIIGQRKDFGTQKDSLIKLIPTAILGGIVGGVLILTTSERIFSSLIPYLILTATLLLALQTEIKKRIQSINYKGNYSSKNILFLHLPIFFASVYGGYFGAGLGVILMAILGLVLNQNTIKLNFTKQVLAFSVNLAAAIYFIFLGDIEWKICTIMIFGSLTGGWLGGKLAGKIKPEQLRLFVVIAGSIATIIFFTR